MALLSKKPIARVQQFLTSKTDDYENWKTRRILGIQPEGSSKAAKNEKRLDYIFCNTQEEVRTSNVICNGKNAPVVSDHYGVMITV